MNLSCVMKANMAAFKARAHFAKTLSEAIQTAAENGLFEIPRLYVPDVFESEERDNISSQLIALGYRPKFIKALHGKKELEEYHYELTVRWS